MSEATPKGAPQGAPAHGPPEPHGPHEAPLREPASLRALFLVFSGLALQGFGGVLPVAQHALVERQRWLDREQFVETLSIAQVLPGPNVVNLALMIGGRFFGWRGALAAVGGMLLLPTVVVLLLAGLYAQFSNVPAVAGALRGMGAVAAGLIASTALRLLPTLARNPMGRVACALVALATFAAVALARWPLVWVLMALAPAVVGFAWWRLARPGSAR